VFGEVGPERHHESTEFLIDVRIAFWSASINTAQRPHAVSNWVHGWPNIYEHNVTYDHQCQRCVVPQLWYCVVWSSSIDADAGERRREHVAELHLMIVRLPVLQRQLHELIYFAGLDMFCVTMTSMSTMLCFHESRADYRGRGRHGTLVADLAGDVSLVCNLASEDSSLPLNRDEFNSSSSSFVRQAGRDLGCFKCPGCAKP